MKLSISAKSDSAEAVAVFVSQTDEGKAIAPQLPKDAAVDFEDAVKRGAFAGKPGEVLLLPGKPRLVALGIGPESQLTLEAMRRAYGLFVSVAKSRGYSSVAAPLPKSKLDKASLCHAAAESALISDYTFDKYVTKRDDVEKKVGEFVLFGEDAAKFKAAFDRGVIYGNSVNHCRDLDNEPANVATPEWLAEKALGLAGGRMKVTVYGRAELKKMGANAILAVASGSANEPKLVLIEWQGKGKGTAFVGKGITFDTGGISIKPSNAMDEMKFDKSGACAVISIMKAVKELSHPGRVVGVFAACENMPSGTAYRPGDIIKAMNGKTIEVLNTDAEGRVILADALAFAEKQGVEAMVDFATLTGAIVVALGNQAAGLFSTDDKLAKQIFEAGEESGDRVWQLPMWPEYDEAVKSTVADVKNIGEPGTAGSHSGASFLKTFVNETPWAHVDIAGTAWNKKPRGHFGLGATGMCVRLGLTLLEKR